MGDKTVTLMQSAFLKVLIPCSKLAFVMLKIKPVSLCPACGVRLRFDREKKVRIRCPKCSYSGHAVDYPLEVDDLSPVGDSPLPVGTPSLVLIEDVDGKWFGPGEPVRLNVGRNIIGRASDATKADVQLPTRDVTMSKMHARVDVAVRRDGGFDCRIADVGSTNGTYCDSVRLKPSCPMVLMPGCQIRLGHTVVKFELI